MINKLLKYYPLLPLLLLCGFYVFKAIAFPAHDFTNYYFGGQFLAEGHFNSDIYFPYQFNKAIFDSGHPNIFASYAPNTPFLAVLFSGFSFFPLAAAKLLFNGISVVLFLFSIYRLFNYYKIDWRYALLIPVLFLVPIKNNLLFGQVYFLLFFLLAEGWLAYEKKQWKSMSVFWGLAIMVKVFPVLLVLFLVFRKQWKPLFYLAFFGSLLLGLSILFTGFDIWLFYAQEVLAKASNGEIATAYVPNYQSVFMFLKEALVFDAIENPNAFFNYPVLFTAVMIAFKISILTLAYFISKRPSTELFPIGFWVLVMILISPYGSTYTFILLLFSFLALLKSDLSIVKKILFFGLLFLINNVPLSLFIENPFPFSYLRMFTLLLFFGVTIALVNQNIRWKIVAVVTFIPMILLLLFENVKTENSTLLLKDGSILIYDYKIDNTILTARFWDGEEKVILWKSQIKTFQLLNLKNNQVFYQNHQLTFDKSNKLKPMLIDGKTVIYLSDYDRGIGFYTLRKINIQ